MSAPTPRRTPTPTTKSKSKPATRAQKTAEADKLVSISTRRRYFGTNTGWSSTGTMLKSLKALVCSQDDGRPCWNEFILGQAIDIVKREEPPRGTYPGGSYINSSKLKSEFLPMGRGFCVTRHSRMACLSYTNFWKQNWE
ncbi:hypothetical protein MJO29_009780 [Puccinia striiformis f. sp. tritici]|uniref:Uncharacterized protein n=2 Tax=Puccinia striiformis TaxID=27350 RepID=A0A0L0VJG8_9BASI|nr:hypothetical protein Pst134EA_017162 [Puccinia striiformis f. sp. tritici]KAI9630458.1 hypothetical protein KEM48_013954 [Puccinia striiformis f. sp. tritici PST-130]KNE99356.1 hypothetical protein PSTG_07474 [Puccinia striiformis f. sp. tritici PST-78]POW11916.1 hypothetical protein PSTT_04930 [Puccinia striiformis]KAH9460847.1 hypothetical protein Pst134EA_017162 [Puccinia striiformis f. sp. tritici]KAI7951106.1 hypothetical protein MJO29_009780 [Puccinia striiformis f. sp. tritici]